MATTYFASSLQHLLAELERLDLLIRTQVKRVQKARRVDDEFQGLYISEQEIEALMAQPLGLSCWTADPQSARNCRNRGKIATFRAAPARASIGKPGREDPERCGDAAPAGAGRVR